MPIVALSRGLTSCSNCVFLILVISREILSWRFKRSLVALCMAPIPPDKVMMEKSWIGMAGRVKLDRKGTS